MRAPGRCQLYSTVFFCVCVVLAAVGSSFCKYTSLLLFAGLFFTFILPPFSVCVQFRVLCVVWHVQQSVSFLNFVCLFVLHFVMWVWVVTHTHTSGVAKSTIGRWANPLVFFFCYRLLELQKSQRRRMWWTMIWIGMEERWTSPFVGEWGRGRGSGRWHAKLLFFLYPQVTAHSASFSEADMGCCLICRPRLFALVKKKKASINIQPDMLSCFFFLTHFMWISAVIYHFFFPCFRLFCFLALSFEKCTWVLTALWDNENLYRRACTLAAGGYLPFRPFIQKLGVVGEAVKADTASNKKRKSTSCIFFFSHP